MSGSDRVRILVARIVEMYELLQALNVAVVKEALLEVRTGGFGGGTLRRCHRDVARRSHLHFAVDSWCVMSPTDIRIGAGTQPPPQKNPHYHISVPPAVTSGCGPLVMRLCLRI